MSVVCGLTFLILVVSVVKSFEMRSVRPYLMAYFPVIGAGFYGVVGFTNFFFPMLMTNVDEALLNGTLWLASVRVMVWGLNIYKNLHEQAA